MSISPKIQEAIYLHVKLHHEHSDIVYLRYFNNLIAITTGVLGVIAFLLNKHIDEKNREILDIWLIISVAVFGIYTCYIFNHYLTNEKKSQGSLIQFFDDFKMSCPDSIYLMPPPFGEHKRVWDGNWSRAPKEIRRIYYFIIALSISYIFLDYIVNNYFLGFHV